MGTNRRWHPGFIKMREVVASGDLGALQTLVIYSSNAVFNASSHHFELMQHLNGDEPATWVQGCLPEGDQSIVGDEVREDPSVEGMFGFANGVIVYLMDGPQGREYEANCEQGLIRATYLGVDFLVWRRQSEGVRLVDAPPAVRHHRGLQAELVAAPPLAYTPASNTLRLVEEMVQALDTGTAPRGGVRVARANLEISFGFIESHRRGGARVSLPLPDCRLRLNRRTHDPRAPWYAPASD